MTFERVRASMQRNPHVADLALTAGVVLVALFTTLALVVPNAVGPPPAPVIVIWALLLAAPLALRRRFPVAVLVVTGIHFPFYWAVGRINEIGAWLVLGVAIYSAAVYGRRPLARRVVIALACAIAAIYGGVMVATGTATALEAFAVAWPLGVMMRSLHETRTALEERNRQLADERETNARRAIVEERVRIARELHDVVAHHVSVIGIQAGVARRLFDRRPQQAAEAIASVETTSRQAIVDLHQIVGFLRRLDDRDEDLAPSRTSRGCPLGAADHRTRGRGARCHAGARRRGCGVAGTGRAAHRRGRRGDPAPRAGAVLHRGGLVPRPARHPCPPWPRRTAVAVRAAGVGPVGPVAPAHRPGRAAPARQHRAGVRRALPDGRADVTGMAPDRQPRRCR